MKLLAGVVLSICWFAWLYPFIFRAPHGQKRPSVTRKGATLAGLLLETSAIFLASLAAARSHEPPGWGNILVVLIFALPSIVLSWSAVKHLGRQFRINAGLYEDHVLVRTGPYSIVRHPIYAGLLGLLLATIAVSTPWQWGLVSLAMFIAGTEIRVRTEDRLLASRFGAAFEEYRKKVPAYIPLVR